MVRCGFWPFLKQEKMYWERNKETETTRREKGRRYIFHLLFVVSVSSPTDISQCSDSTALLLEAVHLL